MRRCVVMLGIILGAGALSVAGAAVRATLMLTNSSMGHLVTYGDGDVRWNGILLTSLPSGSRKVYNNQVNFARFSPDGRQIAFTNAGNTLYIMNVDGSSVKSTGITHVGDAYDFTYQSIFQWTTNGIFWVANNNVQRYIPETDVYNSAVLDIRTLGTPNTDALRNTLGCTNPCCGVDFSSYSNYWCTRDGRRVWLMDTYSPGVGSDPGSSTNGTWNGCAAGGRGLHPYFTFSPDFKSHSLKGWGVPWGHGQGMTFDGYMVFLRNGEHRHWDPVVYLDTVGPPRYYANSGSSSDLISATGTLATISNLAQPPDPPIPTGLEAGFNFVHCVNNDSIALAPANNARNYIYNWKTSPPTLLGTFSAADSGYPVDLWYGPLGTITSVGQGIRHQEANMSALTMSTARKGITASINSAAHFELRIFAPNGRMLRTLNGMGPATVRIDMPRVGKASEQICLVTGEIGSEEVARLVTVGN